MVHTFGTSELIHLCIKCHQWFSFPLSVEWYEKNSTVWRTLMMKETIKMKYVTCPCCGNPLFRVTGNCSVDIPCPRCQKTIICDVDGIYVSVFESDGYDREPKLGIQAQFPNNVTAFCR